MRMRCSLTLLVGVAMALPAPAIADTFTFSTGAPDGRLAAASRPESVGGLEIETADDFILNDATLIDGATFTGLLPLGTAPGDVQDVRVEIYRVFPKDSDGTRIPNVPTRANSPSDVVFDDRSLSGGGLTFQLSLEQSSFTALNSVVNGIHPLPNQTTLGEGPVTGQEFTFDASFVTPFNLPADHYFFIPQVQLARGDFLWLSAPKPIVPPGTPFNPDLQSWIRNTTLAPDWLRLGTDIVGGTPPTPYNQSFTLRGRTGNPVPEPSTLALFASVGLVALARSRRKR